MTNKDDPAQARVITAAFQDALGDYYDSGAIGDPPKREDFAKPYRGQAQWPDIPRRQR